VFFLQDRVDEFMRPFVYENGQWYYRPKGADVSVPLTEEEVNEAEDSFRFRYKLAFVGMWLVVLPALAWAYVQVANGSSFLFFLAALPAYYVGFLFLLWAMASASKSFRKRMWDLEVEKHGGEPPTAPKSAWHNVPPRKIVVQKMWALWAFQIALTGLTLWEHRNNVRALNGVSVAATVTRSDDRDSHKCHVDYAYAWSGRTYGDTTLDCKLMDAHPVGSRLNVLVDPERPGHSMLPGASAWPPEAFAAVLFGVVLLFLTIVL